VPQVGNAPLNLDRPAAQNSSGKPTYVHMAAGLHKWWITVRPL